MICDEFSDDENNYVKLDFLPREIDSEEYDPSGRNMNKENNREELIIKIDYKELSKVIQVSLPVPEEEFSETTETDVEDIYMSDIDEERNLAPRSNEGESSSPNSEDSDSDSLENLEVEGGNSPKIEGKKDTSTEKLWPPHIVEGCIVEYVKRVFSIGFPVYEGPVTNIVKEMREEYIRRSFYKDPSLFFTDEHVAIAIDREYGSGRARNFIQNLRKYALPLLDLVAYEKPDIFNFGSIPLLQESEICEKAMMLFPFIVGEKNFIPILVDTDKKVESSEEGAFTVSYPGGKISKNGSLFILAHNSESTILSLYGAYLLLGISHPKNSQKTFTIIEELFFEKKSSHQDIAEEVKKIIKYCQFKS